MKSTGDTPTPSKSSTPLLSGVPWEKLLIWGLFLLVVYEVRHFFAIIFLTFVVSYTMRCLIVWFHSTFTPRWNPRYAHPVFTVIAFLGLLGTLYGIGAYLVPEFVSQGQGLVRRMTSAKKSPKAQFDEVLRATVGKWLFSQEYGNAESDAYVEAFAKYRDVRRVQDEFARRSGEIEEQFALALLHKAHLRDTGGPKPKDEVPLQEWVLKHEAPKQLNADRANYYTKWQEFYRQQEFSIPGLTSIERLTEQQKEEAILRFITNEILGDPERHREAESAWEVDEAFRIARDFKKSSPDQYRAEFDNFYHDYQARADLPLPYDLDTFLALRDALMTAPDQFPKRLQELLEARESKEQRLAREQRNFEIVERARLVDEWKNGELASKLQVKLEETVVSTMGHLGSLLGEMIPKIVVLPFHIGLILLLSFLITLDIPRLKGGLERLKRSRAKRFYAELAPGMMSFGKLIGRAFQAQGVIAIANTILTLLSLKILGIENKVFLGSVVFLCSFIPVLGVVFSSVPIAIMAIIQPGGGLMLAVWAIVAVLIVHFIETSLLNPRILGNMLHLEPVLVLAILAIGEHFFGVWGLLLGVPVMVYIIRVVILNEGIPGFIELQSKEE